MNLLRKVHFNYAGYVQCDTFFLKKILNFLMSIVEDLRIFYLHRYCECNILFLKIFLIYIIFLYIIINNNIILLKINYS